MNTKALMVLFAVVALAVGGCSSSAPTPPAAPAPSSPDDKALIAAQKYCPIMPEEKLGGMGDPVKIMVKDKEGKDQAVFVCCEGCKKKVLADPARALAKVAEFKAAPAQ